MSRTTRISVKTATGQVALSPHQVANLRGQIASKMQTHLTLADEVVKGHIEWTPTQARVFSSLLNKVIPDLSASYHQHEHSVKNYLGCSQIYIPIKWKEGNYFKLNNVGLNNLNWLLPSADRPSKSHLMHP